MEQKNGMTLIDRFNYELKCSYVDEIIAETRTLKYFKDMYVKHAFDSMGKTFKDLYKTQELHLKELKQQYKDKYEITIDQHSRFDRTFTK